MPLWVRSDVVVGPISTSLTWTTAFGNGDRRNHLQIASHVEREVVP